MKGVAFASHAYRVPGRVVTSAELEDSLGLGRGVVVRLTGIERRRHLGAGESLPGLAAGAAEDAIARSGLDASEIGGLIFYTDSPPVRPENGGQRRVFYDVSAHVQHLLRERGVPLSCECLGIAGSCVSFLLSIQLAAGLIESGRKRSLLLVGAACNSLFLEGADTNVAMTFGDGAAASVLTAADPPGDLLGLHCVTDGRGYDAGSYPDYRVLVIDRKRVAEFAPLGFEEGLAGLWARTGLTMDRVNLVIPHQAGLKIIERGMALAGVPREKVYLCLRDVGNTGAPAVQMALARAEEEGRLRDGDIVALAAFGTGWNYGAAAIRYRRGGSAVAIGGSATIDGPK